MEITSAKEFNEARNNLKKSKLKIFTSDNDDLNRKVLEKENISILLINQRNRKDFQKQRNSGFNQVLAKIAKKKKVVIGINLDEIKESSQKQKAEILARVKQNIKLCNKNKLKMKFISKKPIKDKISLKSFGLVLGMPTWMTKGL